MKKANQKWFTETMKNVNNDNEMNWWLT